MAFDGTTFDTAIDVLTDPATANLTFTGYAAGDFTFTLSSRIYSTSITITDAGVSGFPNTTCTLPINENDSLSATTLIPQGNINVIVSGATPMTSNSQRYKRVNSMIVNGVTRTNGQTITVGETVVTIVIDSTTCEIYAF
jgi:hypothetical protein